MAQDICKKSSSFFKNLALKKTVNFVIPTRSISEVTLNNLKVLTQLEYLEKFSLSIIIVTNNKLDLDSQVQFKDSIMILYNQKMNAAISRNIGIEKAKSETKTFVFLDDDIVLEIEKAKVLFQLIESCTEKSILAPYIEGHYLISDHTFGPILRNYYSWIFSSSIKMYSDIQGKTAFGMAFPPLISNKENKVQWIPGGCMIFNHFDKEELFFDEEIFSNNYQLEDFYLSYSLFLKGFDINMIPISFKHDTSSQRKSNYIMLKRYILVEKNRKIIFNILNNNGNIGMSKFQLILLIKALYNLRNFSFHSILLLFSTIYVIIWRIPKY